MPPDKKTKKKDSPANSPSFEEALEELDAMVETMESGQLPLEKLISSYERGAELISHCESVLGNARKRLDLITLKPKAAAGQSSTDSTDNFNQEDAQEGTSPSNDHNDDEIRLF
jgi:exodeoxyribonuclease VII small subunit